jgi:prepilin-type N-terminal cleavage/methylation domain-containing protein
MPRRRPRRARSGYTLLELVIVMIVIGVLLAIALPRAASLRDRSSVRAAMTDLSAAFSLARRAALSRRTLVSVVLDTGTRVVEVHSGNDRLWRRTLGESYGIVLGSNRDSAVYDPRGFGYGVSNLSVIVRRGEMVDTLTMSRLGRAVVMACVGTVWPHLARGDSFRMRRFVRIVTQRTVSRLTAN